MLRSVGLVAVTTIAGSIVLLMVAPRTTAQDATASDPSCLLRIEGRGTQDVTYLCGNKPNKTGTTSPSSDSTVGLEESTSVNEDAESATIPVQALPSSPSTPLPPFANPPTTPIIPAKPSTRLPARTPTAVVPSSPRNSSTPLPAVLGDQVDPQPNATSSALHPRRIQPKKQRFPQSNPQTVSIASPSPQSPTPHVQPVLASPASLYTPLSSLFETFQQKHLFIFWLFFLQIPLLKVAIDQRSRKIHHLKPTKILRPVWKSLNPQNPTPKLVLPDREQRIVSPDFPDHEVSSQSNPAIAVSIQPPQQEDIVEVAEIQLAQADNQIEQIKVLIASSLRNRASDIHLEPTPDGLRVRYRIDGILRDITMLPPAVSRRTIVALKVMADMDISESRRPQDARISDQHSSMNQANLDIDMRVSTLPCVGGEKAVIRLLPRQNSFSSMDELGFTAKALAIYQSWLKQPQGLIIFTGPTGSGKTSTLYTTLQTIATESINVITVEDPVEYILPSITQTQVNEVAGMTFVTGLRAILRQDPDIIMVGEIRDSETAETAVRAALTGHLVLTTLHTNDAIGAIPRLRDIGPDPGLIADALLGVVAQRLVRRVCPHCAEPYTPTAADLSTLNLNLAEVNPQAWRRGKGCAQCLHSGYLGREAIVELLDVDNVVRQVIYEGSVTELTDYLNEIQFDSFRKAAIEKVVTGVTTIAEIRRVLPASKLAKSS